MNNLFDEIEPTCDICGRGQFDSPNIMPKMREYEGDWNGETGNHALCETNRGWFVNIYRVNRVYGGPEEGGWWYDEGIPMPNTIKVADKEFAQALAEFIRTNWFQYTGNRYSMAGGDDYSVQVEQHEAKIWPDEPPHYE